MSPITFYLGGVASSVVTLTLMLARTPTSNGLPRWFMALCIAMWSALWPVVAGVLIRDALLGVRERIVTGWKARRLRA